jgi:CRP-like cAMP-binding protein
MGGVTGKSFDIAAFLAAEGPGRSIDNYREKQIFFSQGGPADSVLYLQTGRAKLTVISKAGKEATVTLLAAGDFFGEESMAGAGTLRTVTASAITACTVLKIATAEILRVLQTEHKFSTFFLKFIVSKDLRQSRRLS